MPIPTKACPRAAAGASRGRGLVCPRVVGGSCQQRRSRRAGRARICCQPTLVSVPTPLSSMLTFAFVCLCAVFLRLLYRACCASSVDPRVATAREGRLADPMSQFPQSFRSPSPATGPQVCSGPCCVVFARCPPLAFQSTPRIFGPRRLAGPRAVMSSSQRGWLTGPSCQARLIHISNVSRSVLRVDRVGWCWMASRAGVSRLLSHTSTDLRFIST